MHLGWSGARESAEYFRGAGDCEKGGACAPPFSQSGMHCKCRSFDSPSAPLSVGQDDLGGFRFEVSHPSDKNKDVARMGHPKVGHSSRNSLHGSGLSFAA